MKRLLLLILLSMTVLTSCASEEIVDDGSNPAGDIEEGFMTQEGRTVREDKYRPNEFFFKQCEQKFSDSHFSKTSYFCNER